MKPVGLGTFQQVFQKPIGINTFEGLETPKLMGKSKPKNATPSTPKKIIPMKGQAGGKSFLKEEAIWSVALRLPIDSLAKPRVLT